MSLFCCLEYSWCDGVYPILNKFIFLANIYSIVINLGKVYIRDMLFFR